LRAFLLLTLVLAGGPLARLNTRFLPLLCGRRRFGVVKFLVAASNAGAVMGSYHAFSPTPQLDALFLCTTSLCRLAGFPFALFGVFALLVPAVMVLPVAGATRRRWRRWRRWRKASPCPRRRHRSAIGC